MSSNLPSDVLIEILSRLPVKSVVRFLSVSKKWYALMTTPLFIFTHLNLTLSSKPTSQSQQLSLVSHYNMIQETDNFALHSNDESFHKHMVLNCPLNSVNDYFRIVGCCNGLICLSDDYETYTDTIVLWNPIVRRFVTLPKPQLPYISPGACLLGFGYDSVSDDFKVVRIVYQHNNPDDNNYRVPPNVEVYRLRTGTWKGISGPDCVVYHFYQLPTLVNGAVHWVGSKRGERGSFRNLIAGFDLGEEVFREMMMPESVVGTEVLQLSVAVMGTSIALIQYEQIWQSEYCWVWVMKEYGVAESWTRLFTIDMRGGIRRVVGFWRNDEVLLSARITGLSSYNPRVQLIDYLGIRGTNRSFYVDNYVESLVLLDRESRALQPRNSHDGGSGLEETNVVREEVREEEGIWENKYLGCGEVLAGMSIK